MILIRKHRTVFGYRIIISTDFRPRKTERKRHKQKTSINGPLFTNRQLLLSYNNQHHMQERPLPFASVRHK